MTTIMASHPWVNVPAQMHTVFDKLNTILSSDEQLAAFCNTESTAEPITFGWKSYGSDDAVLCTVQRESVQVKAGHARDAVFLLSALPPQWLGFYQPIPQAPYQSFWAMFGQNIHQDGVEILGKSDLFISYTSIVRRVLELSHEALCGPMQEDAVKPSTLEEDPIVGRYIYVSPPTWGRSKLYYEQSGEAGKPDIVFLHTAGSDGRQYHGVMTDTRMLTKCRMTAFDLPGHGRSFPSEAQIPGRYTNNEDAYVGCIREVIKVLGLKKPIVCGASMGGHVCLAIATRAAEVGVGGVIPCQACEHTDMKRQWWDRSLTVNQSLFNPEWTYGMMAPTAPRVNRNLVWHTYSAQAFGMFHGDLDFYFGGWDGRDRVQNIDTKKCPVYMLTGEYDWSTTPELSAKTAAKIPGAKFTKMLGLGHFPATENPDRFVSYLLEAIDFILPQIQS
ncbi:alpha/beta hydrolase fold family protein [Ilyonectria destructans]|nr:alpha/beta hydrolase fold family protein [Ilyonectria destructans]